MASPINRGTDEPLLQRQNYTFDWRQGGSYTEDWKGINPAKMIAKYNDRIYQVSRARLKLESSMAEATFEWSGDASSGGSDSLARTIDRWEVPEPTISKPLISHPKMYDAFYQMASFEAGFEPGSAADELVANLSVTFQQKVEANSFPISDTTPTSNDGVFSEKNFGGWDSISAELQAYVIRQYLRCINGQTYYQDSTYALRHTTNTPAYWTRNIADVNVNCIYSLGRLQSEVSDSSLWNFPLPERLNYKITAAHTAFFNSLPTSGQSRAGYMVGWLKSPAGEASVGRSRVEIQNVFVLDQWPTDTYPPAP